MKQKQYEVYIRIDPVIAELARRGRWNMSAVLENALAKKMGITKKKLVDIRKENKFVGRPTHTHKHPVKKTIYSGIDGKEYCLDE